MTNRVSSISVLMVIAFAALPCLAQKNSKSSPRATTSQPAPVESSTPVTASAGPQFLSSGAENLFSAWSTAISFQGFTSTASKGFGIEAMTPSFLYGKAAARISFHRNHLQTFSTANASVANAGVEYYGFNILALQILVPVRSAVDGLRPYFGGGINFVMSDGAVASNKTQVNFGVLGGMNISLGSLSAADRWGMFTEFGYATENIEADKLVGRPQIADGFLARAGVRYWF